MIKKMNGNRVSKDIQLEVNGEIITNEKEQATIYAKQLEEIVNRSTNDVSEEQKQTINTAKNENMNNKYNDRFTMEELKACIRELPADKAIGDDEIHNKFLKNLPDHK